MQRTCGRLAGVDTGSSILVCVGTALYAGLRFGIAVQAAQYKLDFALDFIEFVVYLRRMSLVSKLYLVLHDSAHLGIVDRSHQYQACLLVRIRNSTMASMVGNATDRRGAK